ncbi:fimbria/pilus periplasmic chaperone, partial [Salmonella enterica subsp. enterica serovar Montevideo]|nr:fimbria/pilus periplasmic chaperone [Salmonella enterica subsp. enterica serovar Montevideo]
ASATPPSVLISGSATGYYGDLGDAVVTEDEPPHNEFTHKLCAPSFFKVKPQGQQTLRIIMASDHLPKDKESVYWLNLQDIPPAL